MSSWNFVDRCNWTQNATVTKEHPVHYVEIIGLPILIFICTIGNILNVVVMCCEPRTKSPNIIASKATKVFLLAMAVSDTLLLLLQLPSYFADYVQKITFGDKGPAAKAFRDFYGAQQWASASLMNFCDWVLIALSIDRLCSFRAFSQAFRTEKVFALRDTRVQVPQRPNSSNGGALLELVQEIHEPLQMSSSTSSVSRTWRKRTAVITVVALLILAFVFHVHFAVYFFYVQVNMAPWPGPRRPAWLEEWGVVQSIIDVSMTVLKILALFIINAHLVVILFDYHRQSKHFTRIDSRSTRRRNKEKAGVRLVLGCVAVYAVTHIPFMVIQCMRLVSSPPFCSLFIPVDTFRIARPPAKTLLMTNYSVNFLLYFALSERFRQQVRALPAQFRVWRQSHKFRNYLACLNLERFTMKITRSTLRETSSSSSTTTIQTTTR